MLIDRHSVITATIALLGTAALPSLAQVPAPGAASAAASASTPEEARAIAAEAYVYFYPLILMDLTRRQIRGSTSETPRPR